MIKRTAELLRGHFRGTDIVGRIGGNEFLVLMKSIESETAVRSKADEVAQALQFSCSEGASTVNLSSSIGISLYNADGQTLESLYAEADAALYRAKGAGKRRYKIAKSTRKA